MPMLAKVLGIAACSLVLLVAATSRASAQSTSPSATFSAAPEADQPADMIGKGYFQLAMTGGEQQSVRVAVKNLSNDPMSIRAYPADGVQTAGGGVSYSNIDQPVVAAGTWVSLDSLNLNLAPGESRRLTATITVAANATPGDHVAGIAIEEAQARPGNADSQVVINVLYRRAIAVVVAVPGDRTQALVVEGVSLSQDARGTVALVQVRDTGNTLLKTMGTVQIGGSQPSDRAWPFTGDTLIPGTGAGFAVRLPSMALASGTFPAHVVIQATDGQALADWTGSSVFTVPGQATPTALPDQAIPVAVDSSGATLSDQDAAAIARQAAATNSAGFWLLGAVAVALVATRIGFVVFARREAVRAHR